MNSTQEVIEVPEHQKYSKHDTYVLESRFKLNPTPESKVKVDPIIKAEGNVSEEVLLPCDPSHPDFPSMFVRCLHYDISVAMQKIRALEVIMTGNPKYRVESRLRDLEAPRKDNRGDLLLRTARAKERLHRVLLFLMLYPKHLEFVREHEGWSFDSEDQYGHSVVDKISVDADKLFREMTGETYYNQAKRMIYKYENFHFPKELLDKYRALRQNRDKFEVEFFPTIRAMG